MYKAINCSIVYLIALLGFLIWCCYRYFGNDYSDLAAMLFPCIVILLNSQRLKIIVPMLSFTTGNMSRCKCHYKWNKGYKNAYQYQFSEACVLLLPDLQYKIFVFSQYQIGSCSAELPGQDRIGKQIYSSYMVLAKDHHPFLHEAMKNVCRLVTQFFLLIDSHHQTKSNHSVQ